VRSSEVVFLTDPPTWSTSTRTSAMTTHLLLLR
jgi:hypothetical protein